MTKQASISSTVQGRREAAIGHSRQIKHVPELENQADSSSGSFAIFTAIRRACI
jgi:hypothetical protein